MNSGLLFDVLNLGKVCWVMNWCSGDFWLSLYYDYYEVVDGYVFCIYFRLLEVVGLVWFDFDFLILWIWLL